MTITRRAGKLRFRRSAVILTLLAGVSSLQAQAEFDFLLEKTRRYEARLEALLPALRDQRDQAWNRLASFRELYSEGLLARIQLEAQEEEFRRRDEGVKLEEERLRLSRQLEMEILASQELPEPRLEARVERFPGQRGWDIDDLPALSLYFQNRFGEALPISARGQTDVHTELGFDHRQGADLALHPDSDAGKAILLYLRQEGIPYVAFRAPVEGAATGVHIHVGRPSNRLLGRQ